jgi:hypothetical protein
MGEIAERAVVEERGEPDRVAACGTEFADIRNKVVGTSRPPVGRDSTAGTFAPPPLSTTSTASGGLVCSASARSAAARDSGAS